MKSESSQTSDKSVKTEKTRNDRFSVFTICLMLAVLIWILIKLSEDHTTTIEYPLEYVNLSADKVIVDNSDSTIILTVKLHGFKLISVKYFQKRPPIAIDFKKLKLNKRSGHSYTSHIVTSQILSKISSQLKYSSELLSISPDTLTYEIEDIVKKKLPVKLNLNLEFEKQHHLYTPIKYTPDSVVVKGPYSVISKLDFVQTESLKLKNLKEDKTFKVNVQNPNLLVSIFSSEIIVEMDIEEFTESYFELTLNYIPFPVGNENEDLRIKTFPEKVKVVFMVALNDYKYIKEKMFTASVDYKDISKEGNNRVKVELTKFPEKVKISRIEPDAVEYIILKE